MKYTTTMIAALSGFAVLAGVPSSAVAFNAPEGKAVEKETLEDLIPDLKKPELWVGSSAPELSSQSMSKATRSIPSKKVRSMLWSSGQPGADRASQHSHT